MTLAEIKEFFRFLIRETGRELKEVALAFIFWKPKTMVYAFGIAFIVSLITGSMHLAIVFSGLLFLALIYKEWVAGTWKHEAREARIKKALEQQKNQEGQRKV